MKLLLTLDDGTYKTIKDVTKRKTAQLFTLDKSNMGVYSGTVRVEYTKSYFNEFDFNGAADLRHKLWPCLEEALDAEFKKV